MFNKFKLEGHTIVPVENVFEFADWYEKADRHVAQYELPSGTRVSTVFLGLDHRFVGKGEPIVFETMVFGGPLDQEQERYCTWEEAEAGHQRMLEKVRVAEKWSIKGLWKKWLTLLRKSILPSYIFLCSCVSIIS